MLSLQEKLKIPVDEFCALWSKLPRVSIKEGQKSLLDRRFNQDDLVPIEGEYPKTETLFIHPALSIDKSTENALFTSGRLMVGLNRSDTEVLTLIRSLAGPLGIENLESSVESDRGFNLSLENLSLLYRHSRLASQLGLSVEALFQLISFIPDIDGGFVANYDQLKSLLDFYEWMKSTAFSVEELNFILHNGSVDAPKGSPLKEEVVSLLIEQIQEINALLFADTIFAFLEDINEVQSRALITANPDKFELAVESENNYRLKSGFNFSDVFNKPEDDDDIAIDDAVLHAVLVNHHPSYLIPFQLSSLLQIPEAAVAKMINLLGVDLDEENYTLELLDTASTPNALSDLVENLLPFSILFKDKKLDAEALGFVLDHLSLFGIAEINEITLESVRSIQLFTHFLRKEADGSTNLSDLSELLEGF